MRKLFGLMVLVLLKSNFSIAQRSGIFIQFESQKYKDYFITIYASGLSRPYQYNCSLSGGCRINMCDSVKGVRLYPDVAKYYDRPTFSFTIPGTYYCGDSIIVNVDNSKVRFISSNTKRPKS